MITSLVLQKVNLHLMLSQSPWFCSAALMMISPLSFCFCQITAIEILSDPVKRRAFDSVDPTFDNMVPSKADSKENFFEVFSHVFERNAR